MKYFFLFIVIVFYNGTYAQSDVESDFKWMENSDTTSFKIYYSKQQLPKQFLEYLDRSKREITNRSAKWYPSCTNPKNVQLAWIAKDKHGNCIVSLMRSGKASLNVIYIFDVKTGESIDLLSARWTEPYRLSQVLEAYKENKS